MVIILSDCYVLTKVTNATTRKSKCLYTYIDEFVNCVLDYRGTRKTANTHDFGIYEKENVDFVEHNGLHMEHNLNTLGKILQHCSKA